MPVGVVMTVSMVSVSAADMVVMCLLRGAGVVLVTDDLGAVLAELAVHCRVAADDLADALDERVEQQRVVAQIGGLEESDVGMTLRRLVGCGVDALDQDTGEQEIREH